MGLHQLGLSHNNHPSLSLGAGGQFRPVPLWCLPKYRFLPCRCSRAQNYSAVEGLQVENLTSSFCQKSNTLFTTVIVYISCLIKHHPWVLLFLYNWGLRLQSSYEEPVIFYFIVPGAAQSAYLFLLLLNLRDSQAAHTSCRQGHLL